MSIAEQNELRADRSGGISSRFHFLSGSTPGGDRYQNQQCQPAQLHVDLEAVIEEAPNRCSLRHTRTDRAYDFDRCGLLLILTVGVLSERWLNHDCIWIKLGSASKVGCWYW